MKRIFRILGLIKPYKSQAIASVVFNLLSVIFSLGSVMSAIPFLKILFGRTAPIRILPVFELTKESLEQYAYYYLTMLIDHFGSSTALILVGVLIVTMSLFKCLFKYLSMYFLAPVQDGVIKDMRNRIYEKITALQLSYYSEERKGDIISRVTNDLTEIRQALVSSLEVIANSPVAIFINLAALLIMSWELTLFVFVFLPVSGYIIGKIGKNIRRQSFAAQNKMGELISIIEETITGLRIIKAFNAEKKMAERFSKQNDQHFQMNLSIQRRQSLAHPVSELLGTIVMVTIMWYGSMLVIQQKSDISAEGLIAYLGMFYLIITPAKSFSAAFYNIRKGQASLDRVNIVLQAEVTIKDVENALPKKEFETEIEFKNLSFRYAENDVLKNINMKVPKGKTIALVGQSGSGKTTLVDLLPRFHEVVEGNILLDGKPIKDYKIKDLRDLMGIVNQSPILFNDTIFNNIAFGVENATEEEIIAAAKVANAHEFIVQAPDGYQTNIGDGGCKLSGGQRQRLSIARAVLKNPPILILDEATSALDTESERLVQDAITKLMQNRTAIVIAHRLSTIHQADEICVMQEGKIIERGKHSDLITKDGAYKKLVDLQKFA